MRWYEQSLGLVEMNIPGAEEILFFRGLALYPPHSLPGLTSQNVYSGSFKLYSKEDLEEFSKLISTQELTWIKENSLICIKNFYTAHDRKTLNHFKDKFIEYKKPINERNIIIKTYNKEGKFMFKLTLFDVYGIYYDVDTNTVNFKYIKELKEWDK